MNRRATLLILSLLFVASQAIPQQSWILPLDSPLYQQVEELFINQGMVPPLEETPVIADDLKKRLDHLIERSSQKEAVERAGAIKEDLVLPFPHISPILELGLRVGLNTETGRDHYVEFEKTARHGEFLDYMSMYEINQIPPMVRFGFIAQAAGLSLLFQPELGEAVHSKLEDYDWVSVPFDVIGIDNNFPFRGIATFYQSPVELRFGRDKLNLGPGKWSTLTLTKHMPYFDYAKARFFLEGFSLSWYLIRLNPTITQEESDYLEGIVEGDPNPEPMGSANGIIFTERSKHYIIGRLTITPFDWLSLSAAQTNLVGGRNPELPDFNPLIIFHNLYAEGTYSVPLSVSATVIPFRGLKLYFDYLFYDAAVGDEKDPEVNPSAMAYQVGLTFLSDRFFTLLGGRFRFDAEFSYVDPWVYGKYYSLRQFTSRIIYVEHFVGRSWVDYPLGFYLGPDSLELDLCLAYGIPGDKEVELWYSRRGRGEVDLSGFGDESDYLNAGEPGYPPLKGTPPYRWEWTNQIQVTFRWFPVESLRLSTWYRLNQVVNRYNESGNDYFFYNVGVNGIWKIY